MFINNSTLPGGQSQSCRHCRFLSLAIWGNWEPIMAQLNSNQLSNEYYQNGVRAEASAFLTSQLGVDLFSQTMAVIHLFAGIFNLKLYFLTVNYCFRSWDCG
jgi:hypothetical protein